MWIDEYRSAHGMELDEFARAVNAYGRKMVPPLVCTITDELIHMLERVKGCVTHPIIANAIAEYCGATPEVRSWTVGIPGQHDRLEACSPLQHRVDREDGGWMPC